MSLATWKAKYYPVPADQVSEADAAAHSLAKWRGLRPAALRRHGFKVDDEPISIHSESCSLCCIHKPLGWKDCGPCPLVRKGLYEYFGCKKEWRLWAYNNDPEPMIAALEAVVKKQKKGEL